MTIVAEIISSVLLFGLVYGMAATVNVTHFRKQIQNWKAWLIGIIIQFVILPFVGFVCIKLFPLPPCVGIILLVITSSPGGSYSNWWCSMFNAELALSVTMTAISTMVSMIMLPCNLFFYTQRMYNANVIQHLDWNGLVISLITVMSAILLGFFTSCYGRHINQSKLFHKIAHRFGNISGMLLISLSILVSSGGVSSNNGNVDHPTNHTTEAPSSLSLSSSSSSIWDQSLLFYIGISLPPLIGIGMATYLASQSQLKKPERVAVAVESCYQNTGIAASVALTMFSSSSSSSSPVTTMDYNNSSDIMDPFFHNITMNNWNNDTYLGHDDDLYNGYASSSLMMDTSSNTTTASINNQLELAMGVTLYYGLIEAIVLCIYCFLCWKISWTKAPADESLFTILMTSYEANDHDDDNENRPTNVNTVDGQQQKSEYDDEITSVEILSDDSNDDDLICRISSSLSNDDNLHNKKYAIDEVTLQNVIQDQPIKMTNNKNERHDSTNNCDASHTSLEDSCCSSSHHSIGSSNDSTSHEVVSSEREPQEKVDNSNSDGQNQMNHNNNRRQPRLRTNPVTLIFRRYVSVHNTNNHNNNLETYITAHDPDVAAIPQDTSSAVKVYSALEVPVGATHDEESTVTASIRTSHDMEQNEDIMVTNSLQNTCMDRRNDSTGSGGGNNTVGGRNASKTSSGGRRKSGGGGVIHLQRTISAVRARAAGYREQVITLSSTMSSSDETTDNQSEEYEEEENYTVMTDDDEYDYDDKNNNNHTTNGADDENFRTTTSYPVPQRIDESRCNPKIMEDNVVDNVDDNAVSILNHTEVSHENVDVVTWSDEVESTIGYSPKRFHPSRLSRKRYQKLEDSLTLSEHRGHDIEFGNSDVFVHETDSYHRTSDHHLDIDGKTID